MQALTGMEQFYSWIIPISTIVDRYNSWIMLSVLMMG